MFINSKKCCAHLTTTRLSFCNMKALKARKADNETKGVIKF